MKSKRSRLALMGVLALALSVTVGLVSGSVADAKKKKSGKVTVSKTTPTSIPSAAGPNSPDSSTTVPLTVGKKAKGKVVGFDSVSVTTNWTGSDDQALGSVFSELIAPNGRKVGLQAPVWNFAGAGNQTSGPTTETPDSSVNACFPTTPRPCPGGAFNDPDATLGPPYAGTIGTTGLANFGGVPAKGTWQLRVFNGSTTRTATLNSVSITITLISAPR